MSMERPTAIEPTPAEPRRGEIRFLQPPAAPRVTRVRAGAPLLPTLPPPAAAGEEYRNLAIRVEESLPQGGSGGYLVAVTSLESGSGKTLTSLNLALALALGGQRRVLAIEGDIWRPTFDRYLELSATDPGLAQVLKRRASLPQAVLTLTDGSGARSVPARSLQILPAGCDAGDLDELPADRLAEILDVIRLAFDVVVIDAPPAFLARGKRLIQQADGILVVIGAGKTRREGIERLLSDLRPEKLLGMALNGVRRSKAVYSASYY